MNHFAPYVDDLANLLRGQGSDAQVAAALDGAVSRELRSRIALSVRRQRGAFFTGQKLATQLVEAQLVHQRRIVDPAVGGGDLLLAAAAHLPLGNSVSETLERWGRRLYGTDVEADFVRVTRLRIALLAAQRLGKRTYLREARVQALLPGIRVGDGQKADLPERSLVVLNPPFGSTIAPADLGWAGGTVSRAALFASSVIDQSPIGVRIAAILPDVLRSGSRYHRWREDVASRMRVDALEAIGQFDNWADVDVFVLRGEIVSLEQAASMNTAWNVATQEETVGTYFDVNVGAVVPHRDPQTGPCSPYVTVRDLPIGKRMDTSELAIRRFTGRVFETPFVVVRRTSRPGQQVRRAVGTVVSGSGPVAVENHLLVCTPKTRTIAACEGLQRVLHTDAADEWLDRRIRCRHLTVTSVRELPWRKR